MRQIKFRGYNRKNKQWLYGFYLQNRGEHVVCPDEFATGKSWDDYEIGPETLGELSGLLDKDDNEIWEGDIIECGTRRYVCKFIEGGFEFCDLSDEKIILKAIVIHSHVIGNIHDNPELIKEK